MLGAWILRSSNLDFDKQGYISGINFEHQPFRDSCKKHFFFLINTAIAPVLQAAARRYLAQKRVRRMRIEQKREHIKQKHGRIHKKSQIRGVIIGSSLESSTTSFVSYGINDGEVEEDEGLQLRQHQELQEAAQQRVRKESIAEEVEDEIAELLKIEASTKSNNIEEVEEEIMPETEMQVNERRREIEYLSKPSVGKKKQARRRSSSGSANSVDSEKPVRKERDDMSKHFKKEDSINLDRKHSVTDNSPTVRKLRKTSISPLSSPSQSPIIRKFRKSAASAPSPSKIKSKSPSNNNSSTPTRSRGHSMSMEELIIEHDPGSALESRLSSMAHEESLHDANPDTDNLAHEIDELRNLVQSQMSSFISEVGALTVSIKNSSPTKQSSVTSVGGTPQHSITLPPGADKVDEESKGKELVQERR